MDKAQAIHNFWSGFDLKAYDELTVPDDAEMPYITYSVQTDSIGSPLSMRASVWDKSTSWAFVTQKAEQIAEAIVNKYPATIEIDGGRVFLAKGTPFAQRMADDDDTIRRMYLIVMAEFLTAS